MTPSSLTTLSSKLVLCLMFLSLVSTASHAQTNIEIEVVGPWSYVQDPGDTNRVILVAPQLGHTMAVFKGDDGFNYSNATEPSIGSHRLDFSTLPCSATSPSKKYLYPLTGVTPSTVTAALQSTSAYSLSLPKPCAYESKMTSQFRYNATQPVTQADPEGSFTTWMILHYSVTDQTVPADLDKGTGSASTIQFGTNSGSTKNAISVTLYVSPSIGPDTRCDSHSAAIFDAVLQMWNAPHVYRVFPKLKPLATSNQQLSSYDYTCDQGKANSANVFAPKVPGHQQKRAPGRADCHAAQVNVNGVVN
jgi:hypothetical protein